jgi:hypothetical protein
MCLYLQICSSCIITLAFGFLGIVFRVCSLFPVASFILFIYAQSSLLVECGFTRTLYLSCIIAKSPKKKKNTSLHIHGVTNALAYVFLFFVLCDANLQHAEMIDPSSYSKSSSGKS